MDHGVCGQPDLGGGDDLAEGLRGSPRRADEQSPDGGCMFG
jgi:hypothetical protein